MSKEEQMDEYVRKYLKDKAPILAEIHETLDFEESELEEPDFQREQLRNFAEVLEKYSSWCQNHAVPFDPSTCTWSDVLEQLRRACEATAMAEIANEQHSRKYQRRLSIISRYLQPGLNGIPDMLAPLHGGLGIVFYLLQTRETNRQDILDTFEDIPIIVHMAYLQSQKFPNDTVLQQSINNLKYTLCSTIPHLIDILAPERLWDKAKSRFLGHKVTDLLRLIERSVKKLEICARGLQDGLVADTTGRIHTTATRTLKYVEEIREEITKVDNNVSSLNDQYGTIGDRMLALEETVSKQLDIVSVMNQVGLKEMLKGVVAAFQYYGENSIPGLAQHKSTASVFQVASPEERDNFLHVLDAMHREKEDISNVIRQGQDREYDAASKSHYAMILGTRRFHAWLYTAHSDLVYVEGPFGPAFMSAKQSPMSYFCATLVGQFEGSENTAALHFFCERHSASTGHLQGPRGLLRSLLTQILQRWSNPPWEVVHIPPNSVATHEAIPTEELCRRLEVAVTRLPTNATILCILDNVPSFEKPCWENDYWLLLTTLEHLVYDQQSGVKFKVLMTSPVRSRVLQKKITEDNRIEITQRGRVIGRERQQALWNGIKSDGRR